MALFFHCCQVSYLSEDALKFVNNALEIHEQFNLAQLLSVNQSTEHDIPLTRAYFALAIPQEFLAALSEGCRVIQSFFGLPNPAGATSKRFK